MGWTITAVVLILLGVVAWFVARSFAKDGANLRQEAANASTETGRFGGTSERGALNKKAEEATLVAGGTRIAAIACWVVAVLILALACTVVVPTKTVGVVTSFGQPTGTLDNGLHFKLPWEKVTEFDAAVQTDNRVDTDPTDDQCDGTLVRIGNSSTACVSNTIRWRIVPDSADDLYEDYRDFDQVRDSLVTRQLDNALNEVFSTYDPLKDLASTTDGGGASAAIRVELARQVSDVLSEKIDSQIEIQDNDVLVPYVGFDNTTEEKISQFQQAQADTRIAEQRKQTATAEAAANRILEQGVTPETLVSKCLDSLATLVKEGQPVPPGFSCFGGSGSLVLPAIGK